MRDARVETDARDIEEQALLYFAGVDRPLATAERELEGRRCVEWDPEFARQTIAGSTWHERKRRVRKRDRGSNLVHRAVAAPGDNRRNASGDSRERKLAGVARTFGDEYV
jgi:hypothetical protein